MRLHVGTTLLSPDGNPLDAQGLMERARAVEAAGLDGIWMGDSIGGPRRADPLSWLLVQAAAAPTLEVGTCILIVPPREPFTLAETLLTIHGLTQGRFTVGVGTGGPEPTGFEAVGIGDQWPNRFKLLTQHLKVMREVFDGERTGPRGLGPWPSLLGGPPIMIGAYASGIWVKRAAQNYDGWVASSGRTSIKTIQEGMKRFRDFGGKRALVCSVFFDFVGPRMPLDPDKPFQIQCSPEEAAERLAWLAEIGFDDVVLPKRQQGFNYYEPDITAEELQILRSLMPKDTRPKPWEERAAEAQTLSVQAST